MREGSGKMSDLQSAGEREKRPVTVILALTFERTASICLKSTESYLPSRPFVLVAPVDMRQRDLVVLPHMSVVAFAQDA